MLLLHVCRLPAIPFIVNCRAHPCDGADSTVLIAQSQLRELLLLVKPHRNHLYLPAINSPSHTLPSNYVAKTKQQQYCQQRPSVQLEPRQPAILAGGRAHFGSVDRVVELVIVTVDHNV